MYNFLVKMYDACQTLVYLFTIVCIVTICIVCGYRTYDGYTTAKEVQQNYEIEKARNHELRKAYKQVEPSIDSAVNSIKLGMTQEEVSLTILGVSKLFPELDLERQTTTAEGVEEIYSYHLIWNHKKVYDKPFALVFFNGKVTKIIQGKEGA